MHSNVSGKLSKMGLVFIVYLNHGVIGLHTFSTVTS